MDGFDFVVFLDVEWNEEYHKNRQQFLVHEIARQIKGKGRVLALERPVCMMTGPWVKRAKFVDWLRGRRGLRQEAENLFIYTTFVWLHNVIAASVPGLAWANHMLLRWQVNRLLKQMGFRRETLVVWIHHPYQLEDVGLVGEKFLVYDCFDDYFSKARGRRLADLKRREETILAQADLVLAASEQQAEAMRGRARRLYLMPNATDFCHFNKAANENISSSDNMGLIKRPHIGYIGNITQRIDFNLLDYLAQNNADWSLVLIGGGTGIPLTLKSRQNVHFLGARPYDTLPAYIETFDVCIIPYDQNHPFNVHCSPLKLYDYLATGKPIVSTDLPAVREFKGLVRIAQDMVEFERQVAKALQEDDEQLCRRRVELAYENSWGRRAEQIISAIEEVLSQEV